MTFPARIAGTAKFVEINEPLVEGCYLISDKGIAVVLLNWSGSPISQLEIVINDAGNTTRVESVEQGGLRWEKSGNSIRLKLPLKTVDVLMLYFN